MKILLQILLILFSLSVNGQIDRAIYWQQRHKLSLSDFKGKYNFVDSAQLKNMEKPLVKSIGIFDSFSVADTPSRFGGLLNEYLYRPLEGDSLIVTLDIACWYEIRNDSLEFSFRTKYFPYLSATIEKSQRALSAAQVEFDIAELYCRRLMQYFYYADKSKATNRKLHDVLIRHKFDCVYHIEGFREEYRKSGDRLQLTKEWQKGIREYLEELDYFTFEKITLRLWD